MFNNERIYSEGNVNLQVTGCEDGICLEAIFPISVNPCIAAKLFSTGSASMVGDEGALDEVDEELFFRNGVLVVLWLPFGSNNNVSFKFE